MTDTQATALFPFSAITGQPEMQLALLLAAIDPAIGGVLIEGPSGTAKSTAARALAELLAPDSPFVTLPLGASLEHVAGSLDLGSAMQGHSLQFAPGLLAKAHGGVLYVDEINLLPDAIVDVLLDAAASGVHTVERDGISHSHPARFVLIGTMNPEEGQLRPQLLDRLGLSVRLGNITDVALRQTIVKTRLAFDADPVGFRQQYADATATLTSRLQTARAQWVQDRHGVHGGSLWSDAVHEAVSQGCIGAGVNGLRADMVWLRAARALAAWLGDTDVTPEHVAHVADLVLAHRRKNHHGHPHRSEPSQTSSAAATSSNSGAGATTSQQSVEGQSTTSQKLLDRTTQPSHAKAAPNHIQDTQAQPEGLSQSHDWGALAPEPAGLQRMRSAASLLDAAQAGVPTKK